ncbi:hypothetical protein [Novosphingobium sp. ST904]|uniref:hypothetical protein n=1 Tax=Novosphingobium sp. ST904 TaxID=1684385 RepID=UPI0006C8BFE3|nr:hypothetical protein [Novosphingobium sp. ST904]KPH59185.1 hypothetical protein ADT71_23885 [Novosphingobium sp. ST904]TCM37725.1 hypothetical protein EDF59_110121 [Novosphingobium sp. ST904]
MSRVTPAQVSFNGGELSKRLQARTDQAIYSIALAEMVGFSPMVEGVSEAMPGTIHVAPLAGPFRFVEFEFSTTQGHVLAFADGKVTIFTNDALLTEIESPYTWAEVQELSFFPSFDVLYCFRRGSRPRMLFRDGAETFGFEEYVFTDGPFEKTNKDESKTVSVSGISGAITMEASHDIFAATDVGGLFRIEAEDLGDITAWEPYTTVVMGQYLNANDRVYRVVGGNPDDDNKIRTGTLTPVHTEGVEWDGIASGVDVNDKPAGGVQLEYIHDKWGVVRITAFTNSMSVKAEVLRRLPFSAGASGGSYSYIGGYWKATYFDYEPPTISASYAYGTYRWSFGSFSDTRGWPSCGTIWAERLCLGLDSSIFGGVSGDLDSFAERNELGEVSDDMAFVAIVQDANPVRHMVADEQLLAITAKGVHALTPASQAKGVAPGNIQSRKQNDAGIGDAAAVELNSRTIYIDRSGSRIYETDLDPARQVEQELDLTRYARHFGAPGFIELASQQHPFNHLWAVMGDGRLAVAAYLPEEQVLGFAWRPLAEGIVARTICAITDPAGKFDQVWIGVEYAGSWHVLRMAPWRMAGESEDTPCMVDMAALYEGDPKDAFTHPVIRNAGLHVVSDGAFYPVDANAIGGFTLPEAGAKVWAGLSYDAWMESLNFEAGGDNGAARGRKARFGKGWVEVLDARGLAFGVPGDLEALEELRGDSVTDEGYAAVSGFRLRDAMGDHTRYPRLRIERVAPFQATIAAWGGELNMEKL